MDYQSVSPVSVEHPRVRRKELGVPGPQPPPGLGALLPGPFRHPGAGVSSPAAAGPPILPSGAIDAATTVKARQGTGAFAASGRRRRLDARLRGLPVGPSSQWLWSRFI